METPDRDEDLTREQAILDALDETISVDPPPGDTEASGSVNAWISTGRSYIEAKRSSSRLVDTALYAQERNRRIPSTLLAGALASRLVVYAIPFFVLTVLATGVYSDFSGVSAEEAARTAGMAGLLADTVQDSTEASQGFRLATLIAITFAVIWAADSLAKLVRRIHAIVWGAPISKPGWRWALPLAVVLWSLFTLLMSNVGLRMGEWPATLVLGEILVEFAFIALGWLVVCHFLPHDPDANRWIHQLPGALLVGFGVLGMRTAMVYYFAPRAVTLSDRYGDVAAGLLIITWAYWIAFMVVFAAELNAASFRSRQARLGG